MVFAVQDGKVTGATMRAVSPLADFSYDYQDLKLARIETLSRRGEGGARAKRGG